MNISCIYKFICILKRFYDKADGIDYSVFIPLDRILVFYNSLITLKNSIKYSNGNYDE